MDNKISGKAAQFDGKGSIQFKGKYPTGNSPRTMATWIKNTRGPITENVHVFTYGPMEQAKVFGLLEAGGCWHFFDLNGGLGSGTRVDTEWHHHCLSYDGKQLTYYIDGDATATAEKDLNTGTSPPIIGGDFVRLVAEDS